MQDQMGSVESQQRREHSAESGCYEKIAIEAHVSPWKSNERLNSMDVECITLSVLSNNTHPLQMMDEVFNLSDKSDSQIIDLQIELAMNLNDELYSITKDNQRYRALANLPMQDPSAAAKELTRCVREYGFVGALIAGTDTTVRTRSDIAKDYDTDIYDELWQTFEELDYPVYIHPKSSPGMGPFLDEASSTERHAAWVYSNKTAEMVLNLMMHSERFKKLKIILPGFLLDYMGDLSPSLKRNLYFTTSGFFDASSLEHLISVMGVSHVIYATDYPWNDKTTSHSWFDQAMEALKLNQTERELVGHKNAGQLFKI